MSFGSCAVLPTRVFRLYSLLLTRFVPSPSITTVGKRSVAVGRQYLRPNRMAAHQQGQCNPCHNPPFELGRAHPTWRTEFSELFLTSSSNLTIISP